MMTPHVDKVNRRQWFYLSGLSLAGCGEKSPAPVAATGEATKAGPFTVKIPEAWAEGVIVQKVPMKPLYNVEDWKSYQEDPQLILKPHYGCRPEHWAIRIPAALPKGFEVDMSEAGDDPAAPQILVHKASEWAVVQTDGKHEETPAPQLLRQMRADINAALTGDDKNISPAFMDAALTFQCLRKRVDFAGGFGIRMLCQWTIEPELMRKQELHYLFVGLSDDHTCQLIATFPVDLPGLPGEGSEEEHLGKSSSREGFTADFNSYEATAKKWLEEHQAQITPALAELDAMISGIAAKTWG